MLSLPINHFNVSINFFSCFPKMEVFINISIVTTLMAVYVLFQDDVNKAPNHLGDKITINEYSNIPEFPNNFQDTKLNPNNRVLQWEKFYNTKIEDVIKLKQKQDIISNLVNKTFQGVWFGAWEGKNGYSIGDSQSGDFKMRFNIVINLNSNQYGLSSAFTAYENSYINNWVYMKSFSPFNKIKYEIKETESSFNNSTLIYKKKAVISSNFTGFFDKGEMLSTVGGQHRDNCKTLYELIFDVKNITIAILFSNGTLIKRTVPSIETDNFKATFSSSCGLRMNVLFENQGKLKEKMLQKIESENKMIGKYTTCIIINSMLYFIAVWNNASQLKKKRQSVEGVSWINVCLNMNWNIYVIICHLSWTINSSNKALNSENFGLISFVYTLIFLCGDLRFLYYFFDSNARESQFPIKIIKVKFYIFFYLLLLLSFFFTNKFFIEDMYIISLVLLLWLPQFIYNAVHNIRYIYPFVYVVFSSTNKVIFCIYFRAATDNFLHIKPDYFFVGFVISLSLISIVLLYVQNFSNPRFFLGKKYQNFPLFDFYKNIDEIRSFDLKLLGEECVICLGRIFEEKDKVLELKVGEKLGGKREGEKCENESESVIGLEISCKDSNVNERRIKEKTDEEIVRINNVRLTSTLRQRNTKLPSKTSTFFITFKLILSTIFLENFFKFHKKPNNFYNKKFMLTPCYHVFHAKCLEAWFETKKECPNCRQNFDDLF